jgi:hypothetical protein
MYKIGDEIEIIKGFEYDGVNFDCGTTAKIIISWTKRFYGLEFDFSNESFHSCYEKGKWGYCYIVDKEILESNFRLIDDSQKLLKESIKYWEDKQKVLLENFGNDTKEYISMDQLINLWVQLEDAYRGVNGYGGDTAEIYAYTVQARPPGYPWGFFAEDDKEFELKASKSLYEVLNLFKKKRKCVIYVEGRLLGEWLLKERFHHRVHVRIK